MVMRMKMSRARLMSRWPTGTGLALLLACVAPISGAMAQTETASANMPVIFKLVQTCAINLNAVLAFGAFDAAQLTTTRTAQGSIRINCTNGTPWFTSASTGLYPDGSGNRRMRSSIKTANAFMLPYTLHTTAGGAAYPTTTGTPGSGPSAGTGNGANQIVTIYGQIPAITGKLPAADTYTDTVVVTLNW